MGERSKESQFELSSPPSDGISTVRFSPVNPSHLLVSSWDKTVRFYDVSANEEKRRFDHRAAVLDCCFSSDGSRAYSAGLDTQVREFNLEQSESRTLGHHNEPVSQILHSKNPNLIISGSWDRTVRTWDPRDSNPQKLTVNLPERVYNMDITGTSLVVAMASRIFHIYDIRRMDEPMQVRDSSLKFLTRAVGCMVDGQGYATASVEGRIAVEYFDTSPEIQEKKYAFKCHRQTIDGDDHVWPVNCLVFHPIYNTFASAGSDGTVSIWDHKSKKRLKQYLKYKPAVPSISFNSDGSKLAIGVSYNWDEGPDSAAAAEKPRIFIKDMGDDAKPKGWTG